MYMDADQQEERELAAASADASQQEPHEAQGSWTPEEYAAAETSSSDPEHARRTQLNVNKSLAELIATGSGPDRGEKWERTPPILSGQWTRPSARQHTTDQQGDNTPSSSNWRGWGEGDWWQSKSYKRSWDQSQQS